MLARPGAAVGPGLLGPGLLVALMPLVLLLRPWTQAQPQAPVPECGPVGPAGGPITDLAVPGSLLMCRLLRGLRLDLECADCAQSRTPIRFGKRFADRAPMRFGKRLLSDRAPMRFGKRLFADRAPMRFGKRFADRAPMRFGKRSLDGEAISFARRFTERAPMRFGKRFLVAAADRAPMRFGKRQAASEVDTGSIATDRTSVLQDLGGSF